MITITFDTPVNNDSLQVGDGVYYINPRTGTCSIDPNVNTTEALCDAAGGNWESTVGFEHSTSTPIFGGYLVQINPNQLELIVDDLGTNASNEIGDGTFIMFAKESSINLSGLIGYYAEVKIKNNSKVNAEMFSIGSEITVSSK